MIGVSVGEENNREGLKMRDQGGGAMLLVMTKKGTTENLHHARDDEERHNRGGTTTTTLNLWCSSGGVTVEYSDFGTS